MRRRSEGGEGGGRVTEIRSGESLCGESSQARNAPRQHGLSCEGSRDVFHTPQGTGHTVSTPLDTPPALEVFLGRLRRLLPRTQRRSSEIMVVRHTASVTSVYSIKTCSEAPPSACPRRRRANCGGGVRLQEPCAGVSRPAWRAPKSTPKSAPTVFSCFCRSPMCSTSSKKNAPDRWRK
jgi:hypothetical protein